MPGNAVQGNGNFQILEETEKVLNFGNIVPNSSRIAHDDYALNICQHSVANFQEHMFRV